VPSPSTPRTERAAEWKALLWIVAVFTAFYFLPVGTGRFDGAVLEALSLARWYAREHVLLCLVPAFFIAGAISVFAKQESVLRYLGAGANKIVAYGVASVSGSILAVCSCTVLPLFTGIYRMGAGLGPASAFLYSGPAINVLAIVLTARVLGLELGVARAVGAVGFSVVVGLLMHLLFRREERARVEQQAKLPPPSVSRPLWQDALFFLSMVGILVFANWGKPQDGGAVWQAIYASRWIVTAVFGAGLAVLAYLRRGEIGVWVGASWDNAKQILPLLLIGVLVAGFLLGRPGAEGMLPSRWVYAAVGGNSLRANLLASVAGAFMYFATLTEVPIVQGLMTAGMGKGPALALLLAGPALSLPSMLVLRSVLGTKKTVAFVSIVVVLATASGMIFGTIA
jgi:hypothetical protein